MYVDHTVDHSVDHDVLADVKKETRDELVKSSGTADKPAEKSPVVQPTLAVVVQAAHVV